MIHASRSAAVVKDATPMRGHRRRSAAFTLLEILIATLLSATLLALLWGTFNMYLRLFERGERVTREAQLLLGLSRQFFESIQSVPALEPPPPASSDLSFSALPSPWGEDSDTDPASETVEDENSPWGTSIGNEPVADESFADESFAPEPFPEAMIAEEDDQYSSTSVRGTDTEAAPLPRFGLVGSYDRLTLYGVQSVPAAPSAAEPLPTQESLAAQTEPPPQADDLRSIHYRFVQPSSSPNRTTTAPRGLLRVETAWQRVDARTFSDDELEQILTDQQDPEGTEAVDRQIAQLRRERDGLAMLSPDELVLLPEVAGIKFRYYTGTYWKDSWDSRLEHRLPLAVEVFLQLREDEDARRRRARRESDGGDSIVSADPADSDSSAEADEEDGWNTLELYDPDDPAETETFTSSGMSVHRILVPCAAAASDAQRVQSGTRESLFDGAGANASLLNSTRGL